MTTDRGDGWAIQGRFGLWPFTVSRTRRDAWKKALDDLPGIRDAAPNRAAARKRVARQFGAKAVRVRLTVRNRGITP